MDPKQFKQRFVASVPETPPELELGLDGFETALPQEFVARHVRPEDRGWLSSVGMPRDAAPFLSFRRPDAQDLIHGIGENFYLGCTGSGDAICIEADTGNVVLLDHERGMSRVFINSSLSQFAECLCLYQEHHRGNEIEGCWVAMSAVDSALNLTPGFWGAEVASAQRRPQGHRE